MSSPNSPKIISLCEGYDSACIPEIAYVRQNGKVLYFRGNSSLNESVSKDQVVESIGELETLEERKSDGSVRKVIKDGEWYVEGVFQRSDVKNANGRIYSRKLWEKLIGDKNSYVQKAIAASAMVGHNEHPADGRSNVSLSSLLTTSLKLNEDGTVYGVAKLLNTPQGRILQDLTADGVRWGISSRGTGSVTSDGQVNEKDYTLTTFDSVMSPSTPGAYMAPAAPVRERVGEDSPEASLEESELNTVLSEAANGKVSTFCAVLSHELTVYDQKESLKASQKGYRHNIYALGHYMRALGDVREALKDVMDSDAKEDIEKFKAAASEYFIPTFAPVRRTLKMADDFLASGKLPKISTFKPPAAESADEGRSVEVTTYIRSDDGKDQRWPLPSKPSKQALADLIDKMPNAKPKWAIVYRWTGGSRKVVATWGNPPENEIKNVENMEESATPEEQALLESVSAVCETPVEEADLSSAMQLTRTLMDRFRNVSGYLTDARPSMGLGTVLDKLGKKLDRTLLRVEELCSEQTVARAIDESTEDRRDQNEAFTRVVNAMQSRIAKLTESAAALRSELADAQARVKDLDESMASALRDRAKALKDAADAKRATATAEAQLAEAREAITAAKQNRTREEVQSFTASAVRENANLTKFRDLLESCDSVAKAQELAERLSDTVRPAPARIAVPRGVSVVSESKVRANASPSHPQSRGAAAAGRALQIMSPKQ